MPLTEFAEFDRRPVNVAIAVLVRVVADRGVRADAVARYFENCETLWLRWCDRRGRVTPTGAERAHEERERAESERERADSERERADQEQVWPPSREPQIVARLFVALFQVQRHRQLLRQPQR
jgi:hypothetical protein